MEEHRRYMAGTRFDSFRLPSYKSEFRHLAPHVAEKKLRRNLMRREHIVEPIVKMEEITISLSRSVFTPHVMACQQVLQWPSVNEALATRSNERDAEETLALLVGLRICQAEIRRLKASAKDPESEYRKRYNRFRRTRDPQDAWRLKQQTGAPYRQLEALLVLGYCLRQGGHCVSGRILRPLASAISQIRSGARFDQTNESINRDVEAWLKAVSMRVKRIKVPESSLNQQALLALEAVSKLALAPV